MNIKIKTSEGDIIVRLFDETPKHRDNFIKLVKEDFYNGTLFHRVIKDFMIQGGDPDSKGAPMDKNLGSGGPDYTIPAEFSMQKCFHKRGTLCAARLGDDVNPTQESSGSQFYIVWGKCYSSNELKQIEHQLNMQQEQKVFQSLLKSHRDETMELRRNRDHERLLELHEQLINEAKSYCKQHPLTFSAQQIKTYSTIGGTPFLDNQYTVFGEVVEGLDVVERIQQAKTNRNDRPINDISMTMEII